MISGCKLVIGCESSNNSLTKTNKIAKKKKKKRLEGFGLTRAEVHRSQSSLGTKDQKHQTVEK